MTLLGIHPRRAAILRYLVQHPEGATSGDIGRAIDIHYRTIWMDLRKLEAEGGVTSEEAADGRSSHWRVYKLRPEALEGAVSNFVDYVMGKPGSDLHQ